MSLLKVLKGLNIPVGMFRDSQLSYERGKVDIKYYELTTGIEAVNIDNYIEEVILNIGKYRTLYEIAAEPDQEYLDLICYYVAIKEYLVEYRQNL